MADGQAKTVRQTEASQTLTFVCECLREQHIRTKVMVCCGAPVNITHRPTNRLVEEERTSFTRTGARTH